MRQIEGRFEWPWGIIGRGSGTRATVADALCAIEDRLEHVTGLPGSEEEEIYLLALRQIVQAAILTDDSARISDAINAIGAFIAMFQHADDPRPNTTPFGPSVAA